MSTHRRRLPAPLKWGLLLSLVAGTALAQRPVPSGPAAALPSLAPLVESVGAAVVNVDVRAKSKAPQLPPGLQGMPFGDLFGMPSPGPQQQPEQLRTGQGSGFIVDAAGLILTNHHVVADAVTIRVRLPDGRSFNAKVLGSDPLTDLALLQIEGKVSNLPVVKLGDSDAMKVGDWVLAIGNPFGLASSVSLGIISGSGRDIRAGPYDDFIQTDAAINPGNSGGPLFNLKGEVIGINTAIVGGGAGIGFAVPSKMARTLLPQLRQGQVVRGWLGVAIQDLTPELAAALKVPVEEGAVVSGVNEDTPAAKAGLKEEDVVVAVDGTTISSASGLSRRIAVARPNQKVRLTLYRQGKKRDLTVTLGTRPDLEGVGSSRSEGKEGDQKHLELGLTLQDMDPRVARTQRMSPQGALITNVQPNSPAELAGLQRGMSVVEADRKKVSSAADLKRILGAAKGGTSVLIKVEVPGGGTLLRALTMP